MTAVIFILFHIILSSVRIFLCLCLTAGTNAAKDPASLPPAAPLLNSSTFCRTFRKIPFCAGLSAALIGALVLRAVQSLWNLPEFYRTASEVLWITLCARLLLRADTRISLFLGIFYETAVSLWLFLFTAWAGVLFHAPAFPAPSSGISLSAGLSLHDEGNVHGRDMVFCSRILKSPSADYRGWIWAFSLQIMVFRRPGFTYAKPAAQRASWL